MRLVTGLKANLTANFLGNARSNLQVVHRQVLLLLHRQSFRSPYLPHFAAVVDLGSARIASGFAESGSKMAQEHSRQQLVACYCSTPAVLVGLGEYFREIRQLTGETQTSFSVQPPV